MEKLKTKFRRYGNSFNLLKRNDEFAIFEKSLNIDNKEIISSYEVIKIIIKKPHILNGYEYGFKEMYPMSEDFGKLAWSFGPHQKNKAFELYESLVKNGLAKNIEKKSVKFNDYEIIYYPNKKKLFIFKNEEICKFPKKILVEYLKSINNSDEIETKTTKELIEEIFNE